MVIDNPERNKVAPMLLHPGTMATVLYAIALHYLGEDIHGWEPETVLLELKDELGVEMIPANHDKLLALLAAIGSDSFYQRPVAFMAVVQTLCGSENPLDMDDPLLPAEMAWGVTEVLLNDDTPHAFSVDVATLAGEVLAEDGFTKAPPVLQFARMPERYIGSSYPADIRKEDFLSTEHVAIVENFVQEQALLLFRQISALPWQNEETLAELADLIYQSNLQV